jgi:hypothetical protein
MAAMRYRILDEPVAYTGAELRSGWVARATGLDGDAAAAFVGPCNVATEEMVDLDDARAGERIEAAAMAHVIVEHRACDLRAAVLRQRLLVCILAEVLATRGHMSRRDGDDLYIDGRKLTVSVAAPGPACSLIHLGINVDPTGAPVPAIGLDELGVPVRELLAELLDRYTRELRTAGHAETKVRQVN